MKAVMVTWRDSSTTNMGWSDIKDYRKAIEVDTIVSMGWVVAEDDVMLAITQSFTPLSMNPRRVADEQVNIQPVLAIPKSTIMEVIKLMDLEEEPG